MTTDDLRFRFVVVVALGLIIGLLMSISFRVWQMERPVIVRQCITIDAPAGKTKVGYN